MSVKGTIKQKRVARRIAKAIETAEDITAGEILVQEGYSENVARSPSKILNSPGVQDELATMGFTEENARGVVGRILLDESIKPEPRLKAAEMVFKVHGTFSPEKHLNVNVDMEAPDEATLELAAHMYAEAVKARLLKEKAHD